jgi:hypothetical protein
MKMILFGVFVLLLACLVIVAAHACWFGLTLDTQIKPVEVLTLAVSIIIAVSLQYYFAIKINDLRVEKDLLIQNVNDVLGVLRSCRDALNTCHEAQKISSKDKTVIISLFRRLSNGIDQVESALGMSKCHKLSKEMESIRGSYFNYKTAATGGSFPSKPYTQAFISEQEQTCRALTTKLQSLIFNINKHR